MTINTPPTKTAYWLGDTLSVSGLKLNTTYADETEHIVTSGYTYTPKTLSTAGTQTVTVSCGSKTAAFTVKVTPKTPTSPKAASASYKSIKISWTGVSGPVSGYAVYRSESKTGTYTYLKSTTSTSCTDSSVKTGKTYYYKVRAYQTVNDKRVYGAYTDIVSAKAVPAVPGSFTAAKASTTSVKTTWKAVTGATGYEVYMATSSSGTYTKIKTTTSLSFTKTGLTKGKTYYFKVRAYTTVDTTKVYGAYTSVKSVKLA